MRGWASWTDVPGTPRQIDVDPGMAEAAHEESLSILSASLQFVNHPEWTIRALLACVHQLVAQVDSEQDLQSVPG